MSEKYSFPSRAGGTEAATWVQQNERNHEVGRFIVGGMNVHQQSAANLTVQIQPGKFSYNNTLVEVDSATISGFTAPAANSRKDRIVVNLTSGSVATLTGLSAASPSAPAYSAGEFPVATVTLASTTTKITASLITDERPQFLALSPGTVLSATVSSASTNTAIPTFNFIANCSGTVASGFGTRVRFSAENAGGVVEEAAVLEATYNDPTNGAEDGELAVIVQDGGSETTVGTFKKTGLQFENGSSALNFYEAGTFTPTSYGSTTAGVGTYSYQTGRYTRIGNRVMFDIHIAWTAHTGAGTLFITGLPYTALNTANYVTAVGIRVNKLGGTFAGYENIQGIIVNNTSDIRPLAYDAGIDAESSLGINASAVLTITGSYEV